ncbi:MAG: hypothetical protein JSS02_12270 [Planctomycetes bacterium]|nr:hypothetical protein [Planctomycetota bacterium]
MQGLQYDAIALLGFGEAGSDTLPKSAPGEVIIRVGAWSLADLRESAIGKVLMHQQDWYDKYHWSTAKLAPGVYRVRMPVPDSTDKTYAEQEKLLLPGEEVVPVALAAAVLLCHLKVAGTDLLDNGWTRCAESIPDEHHVDLNVRGGPVSVDDYWDGHRIDSLWLSAARKS